MKSFKAIAMNQYQTANGYTFVVSKEAIQNPNLETLKVPVLKDHKRDTESIIGKTTSFEISEEKLLVEFQVSEKEKEIIDKIETGLIDSISIGVRAIEKVDNLIKKWTIDEVSVVSIPAVEEAKIIKNDLIILNKFEIILKKEKIIMNEKKLENLKTGDELKNTPGLKNLIKNEKKSNPDQNLEEKLKIQNQKIEALEKNLETQNQKFEKINMDQTISNNPISPHTKEIKNIIQNRISSRSVDSPLFIAHALSDLPAPPSFRQVDFSPLGDFTAEDSVMKHLVSIELLPRGATQIQANLTDFSGELVEAAVGSELTTNAAATNEEIQAEAKRYVGVYTFNLLQLESLIESDKLDIRIETRFKKKLGSIILKKFTDSLKTITAAATDSGNTKALEIKTPALSQDSIYALRSAVRYDNPAFVVSSDVYMALQTMPTMAGGNIHLLMEDKIFGIPVVQIDGLPAESLFYGDFKTIFRAYLSSTRKIQPDFSDEPKKDIVHMIFKCHIGFLRFTKIRNFITKWKKG